MKNYFAFIDESGNSRQERFFGLGLLLIDDEIGNFYDSMKPFYDKAFDTAKMYKSDRIRILKANNEIDQIAEIANSNKHFELKFKYINYSNNLIYKSLIQEYFKFPNIRFCTLIIDRYDPNFPRTDLEPWDVYIHRAAMLLANNIKPIHPCNIVILADDLTRPKEIRKTFEKSLKDAIGKKLSASGVENPIIGVTRLESHASLMLQVVDILLGSVMYDFKKEQNMIAPKLQERQEIVTAEVRSCLSTNSLVNNKTYNKPSYFSVWKLQK